MQSADPVPARGDASSPCDHAPERFSETVCVGEISIRLAGVALVRDGECVTGSAGALEGDPMPRACYELEERLALLEAMRSDSPRWVLRDMERRPLAAVGRDRVFPASADPVAFRWSRSNGVAAGDTFLSAAERARWELIERDRILRSWYGAIEPVRLFSDIPPLTCGLRALYDARAYCFDDPHDCEGGARVVGVFAFPNTDGPLVYGFGARDTLEAALAVAASECIQRLGFLWGEEIPRAAPRLEPTPEYHQEHYLFPGHLGVLLGWLEGAHACHRGLLDVEPRLREPAYVELTRLGERSGPVVVKALPRGHVPLGFGSGHPFLRGPVPPPLRVHPIA